MQTADAAATTGRPGSAGEGDRWAAHPGWARLLRAVIRLAPVSVAALASWLLGRLLPLGTGAHRWLVLGVVVAVSIVAGVVTERLARRLVPLSTLLALTMLFPDQAPSRWKVARSARVQPEQVEAEHGDPGARSLALLTRLAGHDRHTRGHSERVRVFAEMLGTELHLSRDDQDRLRWAALLHDIGKIEVATSLLNKPGKPTSEEWRQLRAHPAAGARLAGPLVDWLGEWGRGIAEHHERVDGSGYPLGLSGGAISRAGRALAVVDAYEVMTAARSYKKPMNVRRARVELARGAGTHFDPVMVRAFLAISLPRLLWTTGPLSFLANLPFLAGLQAAGRAIPLAAAPTAAAGVIAAGAVAAGMPAAAAGAPVPPAPRHAQLVHAATAPAAGTAGGPGARRTVAASVTPRPPSSSPSTATPAPPRRVTPTPTTTRPTVPPGQAKKAHPGHATKKVPPGQAKKTTPAPSKTSPGHPKKETPGSAKKVKPVHGT